MAIARAVAAEIGEPHALDRPEVLASESIVSAACAVDYGLVFEDVIGFLRAGLSRP